MSLESEGTAGSVSSMGSVGAAPERIGRYRVREVIGTGGFATVYRATDERFRMDVALKVLAENHSFDPSVRERFIEEGRRLRGLSSPHLISVHDMGETDRAQPYLVLDWADRGDLAARVAAARPQGWQPSSRDVAVLAEALADGLSVLHARQLVHRDLAPRNILLRPTLSPRVAPLPDDDPGGPVATAPAGLPGPEDSSALIGDDEQLILADLGMSKDLAAASGLTVAAGTSGFAPPEQREAGLTVDHRADIWAASALVVWLVTGRSPDDAGQWRKGLPEAGWSPGLIEALARGLATEPEDRYPTIEAWHAAVAPAPAPAPAPATRDYGFEEPSADVPIRARPSGGKSYWPPTLGLSVIVLGALAVGAITGFLLNRDGSSGPSVDTEELDGDVLRTTVEDDGVTIVLEGLTEAPVDETTELTASVDGTDSWTWIGPDGAMLAGQATLELAPQSPGDGTVRLLAFTDQGDVVEATHSLTVVD